MVRALFVFALCWLPAVASAQTAVLLPVGGDSELAATHGEQVVARVQRAFEDDTFTVLSGDTLAAAMSSAGAAECGDPSCAGAMLTALHAEIAVGVALWHREGLVQVAVVLIDEHGTQVSADADGAEGVIGQATTSALAQARARWATRDGSPVRVIGSPDGATITVDHQPWGTIPYEGSLSPGTHHVVVSADGHVTERRDVEIAAATETLELTFALAEGSDPDETPPPPPSTVPDVGLIAVGAVSAAAGVGALIAGIVIATGSEHCVSGCTGPPSERVVSVPAVDVGAGLAIAGAVAVGVGVVLVIVGATSGNSGPVALTSNGFVVRY